MEKNLVLKDKELIYKSKISELEGHIEKLKGSLSNIASSNAKREVEKNIKNYSHGRFQSVYDYPVLSSSANHIFDLSVGYSSDSSYAGTSDDSKKFQIYNQMAQILVGHDITGSILRFDQDGNLIDSGSDKYKEAIFISFSRLLSKDEIKKGSFNLILFLFREKVFNNFHHVTRF